MEIHELNTKALTSPAYVAADDGDDTYKFDFYAHEANKAAQQALVDDHLKIWHGTSSTLKATEEKAVTCADFVLEDGRYIVVDFWQGNGSSAVKLNVNNTGAGRVYKAGETTNVMNSWDSFSALFRLEIFEGSPQYYLIGEIQETTDGKIFYGSTGTPSGTATKVVDCSGFRLINNVYIAVTFWQYNSNTNTSLNINGTGAYPVVSSYMSNALPITALGTTVLVRCKETSNSWEYDLVGVLYEDATTSKSGLMSAADKTALNQAVEDISELEADKADTNGSYEGMTVGNAEQLLSDVYTEDSEPYKYRASFSGDREIDEIVGGTVAWNQKLGESNRTTFNQTYVSYDSTTHVYTVTYPEGYTGTGNVLAWNASAIDYVEGHVYYTRIKIVDRSNWSGGILFRYPGIPASYYQNLDTAFVFDKGTIGSTTGTNKNNFSVAKTSGTSPAQSLSFIPIVVDLTQMLGSTIATYLQTLENATATSSDVGDGVKLLRKMFFPDDYYAYNAGELISVSGLSAHVMRDANNNIIGNYPLDSSLTLRGIPKLADGKMYFDGDTYQSDGTVTRRFTIVDLGTLTWSRESSSTGDNFYASLTPAAKPSSYVMCQKYDSAVISTSLRNNAFISASGKINITADGYNGNASAFKTAMDGVYMVYELSTPTTETAEPFTNPQIVSEYGTEEYVSTTICPVGHNTKYPENLRKKIEGLPWNLSMIAPIENGTTASKAYSVGQYFLHNNVFCKAKTSIASGATFTLNTNYEETTVAAELYSALH